MKLVLEKILRVFKRWILLLMLASSYQLMLYPSHPFSILPFFHSYEKEQKGKNELEFNVTKRIPLKYADI